MGSRLPLLLLSTAAALLAAAADAPVRIEASCRPENLAALGLGCGEEDREACTFFLDLVDAAAAGSRLVVSGNIHSGSATLESVLLASEDGGRTWTEPAARLAGAGLERIQMLNLETGWVLGHVLGPLPRDPFFLFTSDGGRTWRRQNVFGESRTATVEWFVFTGATTGRLVADRGRSAENGMRYELYETMTGAESWSLREATGRRPEAEPPPPAQFRLRPEPAGGTVALEARRAAGWQPVARFLLAAGSCRAPERSLPDEPPPPPDAAPVAPGGVLVVPGRR